MRLNKSKIINLKKFWKAVFIKKKWRQIWSILIYLASQNFQNLSLRKQCLYKVSQSFPFVLTKIYLKSLIFVIKTSERVFDHSNWEFLLTGIRGSFRIEYRIFFTVLFFLAQWEQVFLTVDPVVSNNINHHPVDSLLSAYRMSCNFSPWKYE